VDDIGIMRVAPRVAIRQAKPSNASTIVNQVDPHTPGLDSPMPSGIHPDLDQGIEDTLCRMLGRIPIDHANQSQDDTSWRKAFH
jgi:hypothetical protein